MVKGLIPNIVETQDGIKYAYEKEALFNVKFIAECNEWGEEFYCTFYAPKFYTQKLLNKIGQDIAMTYGARCTDVYPEPDIKNLAK